MVATVREELKLKRWFRQKFNGWSEAYEPRRGSGNGMPDLQVLLDGVLLPVELKVGKLSNKDRGKLFIHGLEPSQVSWHIRFYRAGGNAAILVGLMEGQEWKLWRLPPVSFELMNWRQGWLWTETQRWENWSGNS